IHKDASPNSHNARKATRSECNHKTLKTETVIGKKKTSKTKREERCTKKPQKYTQVRPSRMYMKSNVKAGSVTNGNSLYEACCSSLALSNSFLSASFSPLSSSSLFFAPSLSTSRASLSCLSRFSSSRNLRIHRFS